MRTSTKSAREFNGVLTRFQDGLNRSLPPTSIGPEELIDATDIFYDPATGYPTTRPGLKRYTNTPAGGPLTGIFDYVKDGVSHLILTTDENPTYNLYEMDGSYDPQLIDALNGDDRPSFSIINDLCLIASGAKLQKYDAAALADAAADAPNLNFITDMSKGTNNDAIARILGCGNSTYRDRLFASGIKDGTEWTVDANDELLAKIVDVGYKDGMDLVAIANLFGYTMCFKSGPNASHRAIYKGAFMDETQYWKCPRYRTFNSVLSPHFVKEVPDGILVVDVEGPKIITAAAQPNEDIPFDISLAARNIAGELVVAREDYTNGFIIIDPVKMIAMIKPSKDYDIFYCMDLVKKRWTYFKFQVNILCGVYARGKMLFGADDGHIYEYDDSLSTDNGVAFTPTIETKWWNIFGLDKEVVKEKYLNILGLTEGTGRMIIKQKGEQKFFKDFSFTEGWWDWATVNALDPADWTEDLVKSPITAVKDINKVAGDYMSVAVQITSGRCAFLDFATRTAAAGRK